MAAHGGGTRLVLVTAGVAVVLALVLCLVSQSSAEELKDRSDRNRRQAVSDGGRTINTGYYSEYRFQQLAEGSCYIPPPIDVQSDSQTVSPPGLHPSNRVATV